MYAPIPIKIHLALFPYILYRYNKYYIFLSKQVSLISLSILDEITRDDACFFYWLLYNFINIQDLSGKNHIYRYYGFKNKSLYRYIAKRVTIAEHNIIFSCCHHFEFTKIIFTIIILQYYFLLTSDFIVVSILLYYKVVRTYFIACPS